MSWIICSLLLVPLSKQTALNSHHWCDIVNCELPRAVLYSPWAPISQNLRLPWLLIDLRGTAVALRFTSCFNNHFLNMSASVPGKVYTMFLLQAQNIWMISAFRSFLFIKRISLDNCLISYFSVLSAAEYRLPFLVASGCLDHLQLHVHSLVWAPLLPDL